MTASTCVLVLPDLVKTFFAELVLVADALKVRLDRKVVVRGGVAEVEACRDSEVRFEDEGKLGNDALAAGACVGDDETGLGGVKNALSCVDELADLEGNGPHDVLTASDGSAAIAIIK